MAAAGSKKNFARSRSWARRYAMQALYQWQLTNQDVGLIDGQFLTEQDMSRADIVYFQELLQQTPRHLEVINEAIEPFLDINLQQLDPVERAILWLAVYELLYRPEVPYRVVINEAVELAKRFGADQGHRFINGVLDKVAHKLRVAETGSVTGVV